MAIDPKTPTSARPLLEIAALFRRAAGKDTGHAPDNIDSLTANPTYNSGAAFLARDPQGNLISAGTVRISQGLFVLQGTPLRQATVGYLAMSAVDPQWQGSGIYQSINRRRVNWIVEENKIDYVCVRTQNPKLFASTQSALQELVRSGVIKSFKLVQSNRVPSVYGQQLTAVKHTVDDPEIMKHFNDLNYEQGDGRVFVWHVER